LKQRGHLEVVFCPLNLARSAWSVYVPQTILDLTHALLTAYKSEPQLFQMLRILPISNSSKLNSFSIDFVVASFTNWSFQYSLIAVYIVLFQIALLGMIVTSHIHPHVYMHIWFWLMHVYPFKIKYLYIYFLWQMYYKEEILMLKCFIID
jgi:hypothetical protein